MRAPRRRLISRRPRAPSPTPRAATRRTPRTAALPSSSSSSSPSPRGAPTARPRVSVAPSSPSSPRPSYCAATRTGSGSSVKPRPPRSGKHTPPTRSSSAPCSSPTPIGTTPSSRCGRWRMPSPRCPSLLSLRFRRIATPSAASRSRTRYGTNQPAFEEAKLKEEKPGLTLHKYKYMIWKLWKKSPDNPRNQVAD